jgi:hypothetical protein
MKLREDDRGRNCLPIAKIRGIGLVVTHKFWIRAIQLLSGLGFIIAACCAYREFK